MNKGIDKIRQLTKDEIRVGKVSREEFLKVTRNPIYLVLDNLKSSHNVGTILRLSDALLVKKAFICGDGALHPARKYERAPLALKDGWIGNIVGTLLIQFWN